MKYNSPLMKILETVANMLIVSFFWIACSIPVLTIIPASAALYHTSSKVIFNGKGQGVTKDFFNAFKANLVLGVKVNALCLVIVFFIIIGLNTGFQIYTWNYWGLIYLILGFLITFVAAIMMVYIPAVVSKFYVGVIDAFRISIFLAFQNVVLSILNVLLLAVLIFIVETIPITIVIVPALYIDLIRPYTEKKLEKFIKDNGLEEVVIVSEQKEETSESVSSSTINESLSKSRKK